MDSRSSALTAETTAGASAPTLAPVRRRLRAPRGSLAWGITASSIGVLVVLPIAALVAAGGSLGAKGILAEIAKPTVQASLALSFGGAMLSAALNTIFGLLVAWVLVRYDFFGKKIVDAGVDLPFALPTAVAGVTLAQIFGPTGWLGSLGTRIESALGLAAGSMSFLNLTASYTTWGVLIAMTFVSIPFVVRSVQPVLLGLEPEVEEAALSLGASRRQTFISVVMPSLRPALLSGFALSFARSLGEFGSVVIISGNIPMKTLTAPVLIFQRVEQYDSEGAAAIALVMLVASLLTLALVTALQTGRIGRG